MIIIMGQLLCFSGAFMLLGGKMLYNDDSDDDYDHEDNKEEEKEEKEEKDRYYFKKIDLSV